MKIKIIIPKKKKQKQMKNIFSNMESKIKLKKKKKRVPQTTLLGLDFPPATAMTKIPVSSQLIFHVYDVNLSTYFTRA